MKRRSFLQATLASVALAFSAASGALRAAAADICSIVGPRRRAIKLPPLPKWNRLTDDIDCGDFVRQVHDYERSLLSPNIDFPRVGQIWETVRDCEVNYQARLRQEEVPSAKRLQIPFRFGKVRLPQCERVRISALDDANKPLQVTFEPLRYDEIHRIIVPEHQVRSSSHYKLTLRTAYTVCCSPDEKAFFNELFRRVEEMA